MYVTDSPDPRVRRMERALLSASIDAEDRYFALSKRLDLKPEYRVELARLKRLRDDLVTAREAVRLDEVGTLPMVLF